MLFGVDDLPAPRLVSGCELPLPLIIRANHNEAAVGASGFTKTVELYRHSCFCFQHM